MNFKMFPFDSQACPVTIESYAYAESEVHFEWRILDGKSPIEYSPGMGLSDFVQGRDPRTANFPALYFALFRPRTNRFWSVDPWFKVLSLSNTIVLQNIPLDYIAVSG